VERYGIGKAKLSLKWF